MKTSRFTDSQIIEWRGQPKVLRCDNGPEYVSMALGGITPIQKMALAA